jgi:hypothetical protein
MGQAEATVAGSSATTSTAFWAHFDGAGWTSGLVPHGAGVRVDALWAAGKNDLWVSGVFTDWSKPREAAEVSYPSEPVVLRFDGSQWTKQTLPSSAPQYDGVTHAWLAGQGQNVWVMMQGGPALADNALAFDGKTWRSRPVPAIPGGLWITPTSAWALSDSGGRGGLLQTR